MNKPSLVIGIVIGLIILSCTSNEDDNSQLDVLNSSQLRLIEESNPRFSITYEYEDDLLIKNVIKDSDGIRENTYTYENDFLIKVEFFTVGNLSSFIEFKYENGLPKRQNHYLNDAINFYQTFDFENDKLIKVESFIIYEEQSEFVKNNENQFFYDSNGNVEKQITTRFASSGNQINEFIYEYDEQENQWTTIPENIRVFFWSDGLSMNKNNFIFRKYFTNGQLVELTNYRYSFNDNGLPIQREEIDEEGNVETTTFSYK